MDPYYEIILWTAASVAILLVPVLVLTYRSFLVRRRLKDLDNNLWNPKAAKEYIRLFGCASSHNPSDDHAMKQAISEEFFGVHSFGNYFIPLFLVTITSAAVVTTIALWADTTLAGAKGKSIPAVIIMSLAGAYIWAIYEILTRSRSQDLAPTDLSELTLRLVAAIPIGYAFSLLALDGKEGLFAFIAAAFPLRDVRLFMRQRAMKKLEVETRKNESRALEGHLGKVLDGLSDETLARLEELGIITYMDLAYANPVRLMARTGYSLRHILAWIDQALLAVYAPQQKLTLSQLGIQCSLDAREFYEAHCWNPATKKERDWANDASVKALASGVRLEPLLLVEILREVHVDPHVEFLNTIWYSRSTEAEAAKALTAPVRAAAS
jgi:hypothetical protein